jgi:hypothetical protein
LNNSPWLQFLRATAARFTTVLFRRREGRIKLDEEAKIEAERLDRIRQPWKYPPDQD